MFQTAVEDEYRLKVLLLKNIKNIQRRVEQDRKTEALLKQNKIGGEGGSLTIGISI